MTITKEDILSLNTQLSGNHEGWDGVYQVGSDLMEAWGASSYHALLLGIVAGIPDSLADFELVNGKINIADFDPSLKVNSGDRLITIGIETYIDQGVNRCYLYGAHGSGFVSGYYDQDGYITFDRPSTRANVLSAFDMSVGDLQLFATQVAEGVGITKGLADICTGLASAASTVNTTRSTYIEEFVNGFTVVPQPWRSSIIESARNGGGAVLSAISNILESQKDTAQTNYSGSTDIAFRTFSAGIVLKAASEIVTAAGLALFGISRLLGVVVSIIGKVFTFIGKVIDYSTTAIAGTKYKIHRGQPHFFNFVTARRTITMSKVAYFNKLNTLGLPPSTVNFTLFHDNSATVDLVSVARFEGDNVVLSIEEHLSTDYDLGIDTWSRTVDGEMLWLTCENMPFFKVRVASSTPYQSLEGIAVTDYAFAPRHGGWYSPVSFSLVDQYLTSFNSEVMAGVYRRLLSAMIIRWVYMATRSIEKLPDFNVNVSILFTDQYDQTGNTLSNMLGQLATRLAAQLRLTLNGGSAPLSDTQFSGQINDLLLQLIADTFNGIPFCESQTDNTNIRYWVFDDEETHEWVQADNNVTSYPQFWAHGTVCIPWPTTASDDSVAALGCFDPNGSVDLPDSYFSSYVAGLFVDAIILVTAAAIAVAATVGFFKLRTKAAQAQAKMEKAWYDYQDDPSAANWKQYAKSRRYSNLIGSITGLGTTTYGLYSSYGDESPDTGTLAVDLSGISQLITG